MIKSTLRRMLGASIAAATFVTAAPAIAGQCSATDTAQNPLTGAPTAPKAVTDDVLGSIDLGPEISVADRQLRMRKLVVQPGGIVPLHSHGDRPALILTVSGTIKEYRSTCAQPIVHSAGDLTREAEGISHYWVNDGKVPAVLYSADVHHGM